MDTIFLAKRVHSIRFRYFLFILTLLLLLLLLLNTYPIVSSRDTVFQEKQRAMTSQAAVVASALGGLERLSRDGVTDVFRFQDLGTFDRIVVADPSGNVIYDDRGGKIDPDDLQKALSGKGVFRSVFSDAAFQSCMSVPVGSKGDVIGAVSLFENDTERAGILLSIQHRIAILSLVIGAGALLLAWLFSGFILRRFYSLADSMHTVAGGNYA